MPTNWQNGNASHEYTTINTSEDPDSGGKENAEKKEQTEPRRLKEFTIFTFIALCWDVFLTLMPIPFLGEPAFSVLNGCFLDPSSLASLNISLPLSQLRHMGFWSQQQECNVLEKLIFQLMAVADPIFD